jgi:hypothetical protein
MTNWINIENEWMNLDVFYEIGVRKNSAGQFMVFAWFRQSELIEGDTYTKIELSPKIFNKIEDADLYLMNLMSQVK